MNQSAEYYSLPGQLTGLFEFKDFTDWLSPDPRVIFQVVQGLLVHDMWLDRYGIMPQQKQLSKTCTRSAKDLLLHAQKLSSLSLALPHNPEDRVVGSCREFALLAAAFFRAKGIPARARCGFALYLALDGFYEDHWLCEYWNGEYWVAIDSQIDPFQQSTFYNYAATETIGSEYKKMLLTVNPLDVSKKHFINAGVAWKLYRSSQVPAEKFGISSDPKQYELETLYGPWFIRGQLLRDFAALNKVEAAPFLVRLEVGETWDAWRLVAAKDEELQESDLELLDTIAELCINADNIQEIRNLFQGNELLYPLL